jgi:hypothetical protein
MLDEVCHDGMVLQAITNQRSDVLIINLYINLYKL